MIQHFLTLQKKKLKTSISYMNARKSRNVDRFLRALIEDNIDEDNKDAT